MGKMTVHFRKCIQDSQEYGSDDEHMVSRVFFDIEHGPNVYRELYADLKQVVGGDFESASIEVSRPHGYTGPLNYSAFRGAAEDYFRGLVGRAGSGIRIQGAGNVRMQNNTYMFPRSFSFNISDPE